MRARLIRSLRRRPGLYDALRYFRGRTRKRHAVSDALTVGDRPKAPSGELGFGVNLSGFMTGEFGLAEAGRAMARVLDASTTPHAINNFEVVEHQSVEGEFVDKFTVANPFLVNLVAINVDMIDWMFGLVGRGYFDGHVNIGIWYWELPTFPSAWLPRFSLFDEIWVMSSYCRTALESASPVPVRRLTYPLRVPETSMDRERFEIAADVTAFLCYFDYRSIVQRKNPLGVIRAFVRAFGKRSDRNVVLIVKTVNRAADDGQALVLEEAARGSNIRFLDQYLDRAAQLQLIRSVDCLVSLHRAEGLGLGMAEAMSLGTPVIATAYSGNMDFMTPETALLVEYRLKRLRLDYGVYERGSLWADPDEEMAAEHMRRVVDDPQGMVELASRARDHVASVLDPSKTAAELQELIERRR